MALFEVPGWTVPSTPVSVPAPSKKRKRRASHSPDDLQSVQANLEKLVKILGDDAPNSDGRPSKKSHRKSKAQKGTHDQEAPRPGKMGDPIAKNTAPITVPKKKKDKKRRESKSMNTEALSHSISKPPPSTQENASLTSLQKRMRESLDGARFRLINEKLYKSESSEALEMMKEDPRVFQDYHIGFRHQVQSWPSNPVAHYIDELSAYPPKTVVADLGCGDATLAKALHPKNLIVLSFDLLSDGRFVVEADVCSRLPLPGSGPSSTGRNEGEAQVVDVVDASGKRGGYFVQESGELKIAEVASRITTVDDFISLDDRNTHFTLFQFRKVARTVISEEEWTALMSRSGNRHVLSHPLVNARLSQLRQTATNSKAFREGIHDISLILGIEASRDLEEEAFHGQTPIAPFTGSVIKPRIGLTPILRAGLGMTDALLSLF
ncbi:hypothetical protein ID866_11431, partial [Astraeus odoratus]